jgi:hypothetical protein
MPNKQLREAESVLTNIHCECPDEGILRPGWASTYNEITELPYVNHKPGKCQCTNELILYQRGEKTLWLCSCCVCLGDKEARPDDA